MSGAGGEAGPGPVPGAGDEQPQVLETALVGPPATRVQEALGAVAFYAATPQARPRPGRIDRLLWGAGVTLHAARLVWTDQALRKAALLPTALTVAGCLVMAWLFSGGEREVSTFHAFVVTFVALASMPPTVLQRLWIRVANEARRALGQPPGEDPFPGESFLRLLWREGWKTVRQAVVVSAGLAPLLGLARLLPFGRYDAAVLGGAWAFYWVIIDAFEIPMEVVPGPRRQAEAPWYGRMHVRLGLKSRWLRPSAWFGRLLSRLTAPWNEEVHFTERHPWEVAGFGLVAGSLLAVPVLGLFFRSVAITAATGLMGRLGEAGEAPAAAPAAPPPLPPPAG